MEAKTTEWRAGPNVCRCCLSEGCYKDISTEYFWMGKREVYAEMLSDTLSVSIAYSQSGGPNSNSRLICELCISRLRDASDFKRQVLECEKTFMQHLDAGSSAIADIEVQVEPTDSELVKLERVKQEKRLSDDDDDFDDRCGFDDDDDDDLDDQPLTKLASKIPKKESVDLLDLLDNTKATEKRKSSSKTKSVPAKKTKTVKKEVKASASKIAAKTEKKKKVFDSLFEARQNAKLILRYTTAYPFKIPGNDMVCVYCCDAFEDPEAYRRHMKTDHYQPNIKHASAHIMGTEECLKVDCTDLGCKLCAKKFDSLTSIAEHLVLEHDKRLNLNAEIGLQTFKLGRERWVCATCHQKFPSLRCLSRHNSVHYHKYTCETCGKSYISRENLKKHILFSHTDNQKKICPKCKKSFPNLEERRAHVLASKRCWPFCCNHCGQRFVTKKQKTDHLAEAHNVETNKLYTCPECQESFTDSRHYRTHYIVTHTDDNFVCQFCGAKFATKSRLEAHKLLHTGEKRFHCTSCNKSFVRKKNLTQHMWIHSEHKRFHCDSCNRHFNQRVSWKTHMRSYHPELVDF